MRSQYAINGSWVSLTRLVMFFMHNTFQYSMNPDMPLMISGLFLMGSGLQGDGSSSAGAKICHSCLDATRVSILLEPN